MKKNLIISTLLLLLFATVSGQNYESTPVTISNEKVSINGKIYLLHRTLQGQTLFSIGKAYNITVDDILEINPQLKSGLKNGDWVYIPSQQNLKDFKTYKVKWYDTLDDIANKFDVSVDAICALNNIDKEVPLKKRQKLFIPDKNYIAAPDTIEIVKKTVSESVNDYTLITPTEITHTDTTIREQPTNRENTDIYRYKKRSYTISIILPFEIDSTKMGNTRMMDYYSGSLIALNNFNNSKPNHKYSIKVVNLNNYHSASDMISSGVIDNSELVIGPIFIRDLEIISNYCKSKRIPIVSPFDYKTEPLIENNPFFFQYSIAPKTINESLYNIFFNKKNDNIKQVMIYERGYRHSSIVNNTIAEFKKHNVKIDSLSYHILDGRLIQEKYKMLIDSTRFNRVIVASNNEAFVSDVLRNLNLLKKREKREISVYGSNRWKSFDILDLEYYHYLNAHIPTQYHINYSSPLTESFVNEYFNIFNTRPSNFAFQGYDITTFFLEVMDRYGREFPIHISDVHIDLLQSNIRFEQISTHSGFINKAIRNVVFREDWSVSY